MEESEKLQVSVEVPDHPNEEKVQRPGWQKRYLGILLALLSSFLFPLIALLVKALVKTYHPFNVSFWRFQGILLPAIPMALCRQRGSHKKDIFSPLKGPKAFTNFGLLILRGLCGASAVIFQFYSLRYITIADSSVISFSTPVWVTLLAHFTLKEPCGVIPILAGLLSLLGVFIISRPPLLTGQATWDYDTLTGVSLAFSCMICATSTFVILRKLRTFSYALLNLFFGVWGSLETLFLSAIILTFAIPQTGLHWGFAIALGFLSFITQLCMTLAFKYETAGVISLVRTGDVIFTFGWQYIVFQIVPDIFSVLGAIVVLTGIAMVGIRKWVTELPDGDSRKERFSILLI